MRLSAKCQYALRALLELACRGDASAVSLPAIARSQRIPEQFLQAIMRELRQGGFVTSRRGKDGGYLLAADPATITVGAVVRFVEGRDDGDEAIPDDDPFADVRLRAAAAADAVCDGVSLADVARDEQRRRFERSRDYVI